MITATLKGIVTDLFPQEAITPNFNKRVFWMKESDRETHPQHWEVELHNDDIKRLAHYQVGDRVEVEVEIRGKKYTKRGGNTEGIIMSLKAVAMKLVDRPGDSTYPAPKPAAKLTPKNENQGSLGL
jgi:hypothetical protein